MLLATVGEEVFLNGVSLYLKKHLYGNTNTQDLWDSISEAAGTPLSGIEFVSLTLYAGIDVAAFMDSWVTKVGHQSRRF